VSKVRGGGVLRKNIEGADELIKDCTTKSDSETTRPEAWGLKAEVARSATQMDYRWDTSKRPTHAFDWFVYLSFSSVLLGLSEYF
jgi:hypothetical protein